MQYFIQINPGINQLLVRLEVSEFLIFSNYPNKNDALGSQKK